MFGATRLAKNVVQIKSLIRDIVLELILVQVFQLQTLIGVNKNVFIFGVDNSPSVYIDNKEKNILALGKGLTQGLEDTTTTAEAEYSINFSRSQRKFCLSLHYDGSNNFSFINATKIY